MTSSIGTERAPAVGPSSSGVDSSRGPSSAATSRAWYLRPPRLVLVATAAFAAVCAFWSVFTPLAEAPDEPAHLGLVLHVADTGRYPDHDGLAHTAGIFGICQDYATTSKWCLTPQERAAGIEVRARPREDAPPKGQRQKWSDDDFGTPVPDRLNQMPQHPPLYYAAMAAALRVERAVLPTQLAVDRELAFLRLLNVFIVLPIPWLAWSLARRLGAGDEVGVLAALVPLCVPQLTHIGATLNNDNLFVVLASVVMALLAGVARGDRSRRTLVLVGLMTGLALLTKGFGIVLLPVVIVAYGIGSFPSRSPIGRSARRGRHAWRAGRESLAALAVASVVAGWWYGAKLVATGRVMPSIEDGRLNARNRPPTFRPDLAEYVQTTVSRVVEGFWGAFGWRTVLLPTVVSAAATLLGVAAVALAFRRRARADADGATINQARLAILLAPMTLLAVFVVVRSAVIYLQTGRLAFQQGRYLFAGLTSVAVVAAIGARHLLGRRAVPAAILGAFLMQGLAVAWCLDGWWWTDGAGLAGSFGAVVAWSGWPDPMAITILVLAPVALVVLARAARRGEPAAQSLT